ncbi:hypothetical protein DVB69_01815 [Sporosarcina sp. BI001-red]|uniref:hypothetical protein n=1 Tax=Sporosarcina sp. BI001-red TaxID=2282866 RepID=UPI000E25E7E7|nr:hypothetical protein [Sporosarcina sp. BI001-red]REB09571.1 hypothetical protein DVB69_01815 [Sporosarcina sp. BI001-red]
MGYLLPIQNIQSQMYANRMENVSPSFAYINRVQSVKLQTQDEEWQKVLRREQERNTEREFGEEVNSKHPLSPAKNGFIQPDPTTLSKQVAVVVGKGMAVNEYA